MGDYRTETFLAINPPTGVLAVEAEGGGLGIKEIKNVFELEDETRAFLGKAVEWEARLLIQQKKRRF